MTLAWLAARRPSAPGWVALGAMLAVGAALAPLPLLVAVLAALSLGALVCAIGVQPALGIALTVALGPFQPLENATLRLPLSSAQVMLGLTLLAYAARSLALRRAPRLVWRHPIWLAFAAYGALGAISFFAARDVVEWAGELIKWAQMLLVAALVAGEDESQRRAVLVAVIIGGFGQALFGIYQAHLRGEGPAEFLVLGAQTRYRAYGTLEQPNPYGGFMGLIWPLAAALAVAAALTGWQRRRWCWFVVSGALIGVAAASFYALIASGSRGALVGAAAAGLAMTLVALPRPGVWALTGALVLAVAYGFDWINIPAGLEAQIALYGDLDVRNAHVTPVTFSTIERLAHWQAAVRMIEAHPWLGVGWGNYAAAYPSFRLLPWQNALGHAHNIYLNVFAETGVLGLLTYVIAWVIAIALTWRLARQARVGAWWSFVAVGVLGAWAHLSAHHLFDKLYVANLHLLMGAYLSWVMRGGDRSALPHQESVD